MVESELLLCSCKFTSHCVENYILWCIMSLIFLHDKFSFIVFLPFRYRSELFLCSCKFNSHCTENYIFWCIMSLIFLLDKFSSIIFLSFPYSTNHFFAICSFCNFDFILLLLGAKKRSFPS